MGLTAERRRGRVRLPRPEGRACTDDGHCHCHRRPPPRPHRPLSASRRRTPPASHSRFVRKGGARAPAARLADHRRRRVRRGRSRQPEDRQGGRGLRRRADLRGPLVPSRPQALPAPHREPPRGAGRPRLPAGQQLHGRLRVCHLASFICAVGAPSQGPGARRSATRWPWDFAGLRGPTVGDSLAVGLRRAPGPTVGESMRAVCAADACETREVCRSSARISR